MPAPVLRLRQEFLPVISDSENFLYSVILGPQYGLHRYDVPAEKAALGTYDRTEASSLYVWPNKAAGSVIELNEARLVLENTLLRYYKGTNDASLLTDGGNRLYSGLIYATNTGGERTPEAFGERDVAIGDQVRLTWIDADTLLQVQFWTEVAGLLADATAGTAAPDINRVSGVGDKTEGDTESVTEIPPTRYTTAYDVTAFDGLPFGYPEDTYTVRVKLAGFGNTSGGGLDGTILTITSSGGDANEVALSASNYVGPHYEVGLGARGALLQVTDAGSGVVSIGDFWRVTVAQDYTEVDVADAGQIDVAGPYTGPKNTQYVVTISSGGKVGTDDLVISVRTSNGADVPASVEVPATDFAVLTEVDYALGSKGMSLTLFKDTQYRTGDQLTFDVEAPGAGPIHTLILSDTVDALTTDDISVELFVYETADFPEDRRELTQDDITVLGNTSIFSDLQGVSKPFPVEAGQMFMEYRELLQDNTDSLGFIENITDVEDVLGAPTPDNPLAKAVYAALEGTASEVGVYYLAVGSDDLSGYTDALKVLEESRDVYSLVPLTNDKSIHDLIYAHVLEQSGEITLQWRIAWFPNTASDIKPIYVQKSNGDDLLVTIEDYGGLPRLVNVPGGLLITRGVQGGDTLRFNYDTDADGNATYDEALVDRVLSETQATLLSALTAPITVPIKGEFHRTLDNDEFIDELSAKAAEYNHRRIYMVYGDNPVDDSGNPEELFYTCARLAGLRSSVAPHQPLSRVQVPGLTLSPLKKFGRSDFDNIVDGGTWALRRTNDGIFQTVKQVSSSTEDDLNFVEQSITTNVDDISRVVWQQVEDLYGRGNVSDEMIQLLRQRINKATQILTSRPYPPTIGPQLQGLTITLLQRDPVLQDSINLEIAPLVPKPLNDLNIVMKIQ